MTELDPVGLCECGCGQRTLISKYTRTALGHVKGQPLRFVNGHNRRGERRERYEIEDCGYATPCWVWQLALNVQTGYGYEFVGRKHVLAHRFVYEQYRGPIPAGLNIDHLCRNRACVNPDHLEPVTSAVNTQRGDNAKLTPTDVAAIRRSGLAHGRLAEIYGVHPAHISRVKGRKVWTAIQMLVCCDWDQRQV